MPTPNRGYPIPAHGAVADVPDVLELALDQVDADVQTLVDEMGDVEQKVADRPTRAEVTDQVQDAQPDLTPYPQRPEVVDIAREYGTPPGDIPIFATLAEAEAWEASNPGRRALTTEPVAPDVTPPSAGLLTVSPGHVTANLSVSGASDDRALDGYSFRRDGGAWSAWQAGPTYTSTSLAPSTGYSFQHRVRDRAGNETVGTAVTASTTAKPPADWSEYDAAISALSPTIFLPLMTDASNTGSGGTVFTNSGGTFGQSIAGTTGVRLTPTARITASLASIVSANGTGTLSAVVRADASNAGVARLLGSGASRLDLYAMRPSAELSATGGAATARADAALTTGTAYHLAVVFGQGTIAMYVNGASVSSGTWSGVPSTGTADFTIGTPSSKSSPHVFDGTVTRVAGWSRALTAAEVESLAGKAAF